MMKKTTLILFLFVFALANAQELNQPANWPNSNWSITGTYAVTSGGGETMFTDNPTTDSSSFSFDDDAGGSGSDNAIAAESPIIDLTAAYNANESWIRITASYVLNVLNTPGIETLSIQYWDADAGTWTNWGTPYNTDTTNSPGSNFCAATPDVLDHDPLNIAGFTANQLSNFRYRIFYNDNGVYGWGFCFSSPTIYSTAPPACPNITGLTMGTVGLDSALVFWTAGDSETSWEIAVQAPGTGVPSGSGTATSNNNPHTINSLSNSTSYEVYVRGNCGGGDYSNWIGPVSFTTLTPSRINFSATPISVNGNEPFQPAAVVDMDGDFLDDIVGVTASNINIHQQRSIGGFTERNIPTTTVEYTPDWSIAAADYDKNGKTDLLYGDGHGVTFMRASNDGNSFTLLATDDYVFSQRSNFVDINNDGHLDAFVCHDVQPNVYYINDGSGDFTFYQSSVTPDAPYSLGQYSSGGDYGSIWIDYNNDGKIDMFTAKCGGETARRTNQMHTNNGDFTYTENATSLNLDDPMQTWSSTWGDYDNDGDMDVFVGASSGSHKLMRNNGAPNYDFTDVTAGAGIVAPTGHENVSYDIDNDGYLDIISNGSIMYGKGDLTFEDADNSQINYKNGSFGDLNNDGFIDTYYNQNIYYNLGNGNNWIKINTVGTVSNANGIGARVVLTTNTSTQIRDVRSGEGFEFMSSLTTHFGLGSEDTIASVTVYWPSGIVDTVNNPTPNSSIVIVENSTLSVEDQELQDVSIYPNPVEDILTISTGADLTSRTATVFDINGKRVMSRALESNALDVSKLQSGVYFLSLDSVGKSFKRKFIKK